MTLTAERPPETARETQAAPQEYHWTVESFYRALDAHAFAYPERLELIHGRILENMGQSPQHSSLAAIVAEMLRAVLPPTLTVREEKPVHIAFDGEPIPDVSVVNGSNLNYRDAHPTPADAVLLVEIAASTAEYDLGDKAGLYAQAGVTDYWAVLPSARQIVVHRAPSETGYGDVSTLGEADTLSPLAASNAVFNIGDLFGQ